MFHFIELANFVVTKRIVLYELIKYHKSCENDKEN